MSPAILMPGTRIVASESAYLVAQDSDNLVNPSVTVELVNNLASGHLALFALSLVRGIA